MLVYKLHFFWARHKTDALLGCPCLNRTSATRVKVSWTTIILTGNINNIVVSANTLDYAIPTCYNHAYNIKCILPLTPQQLNGALFSTSSSTDWFFATRYNRVTYKLITDGVEPSSVPTVFVSLMSPFCYHIWITSSSARNLSTF